MAVSTVVAQGYNNQTRHIQHLAQYGYEAQCLPQEGKVNVF